MTTTAAAEQVRTGQRATWAWWGTAAGVLGVLTNVVLSAAQPDPPVGVEVVDSLTRGRYHATAVMGFLAATALLLFAAGLWRWADRQASTSLALRAAPMALVASAGAMIAGYGVKGQIAEYLPGGMNPDNFTDESMLVFYLLDDLAGYFAWWGVAVALLCLAVLAFRERLLPRWTGAVAGFFGALPVLYLLAAGFTGFAGIAAPVALVVVGTGLALQPER